MALNVSTRIAYRKEATGIVGRTVTFVTVGDRKEKRAYDYPVVRFDDLTPEAQEHVLPYFKDEESASNAIEFGLRNRLAGAVASKIRNALVAPGSGTIRKNLMEIVGDLMIAGEADDAKVLLGAIRAATTSDVLVALWETHLKE